MDHAQRFSALAGLIDRVATEITGAQAPSFPSDPALAADTFDALAAELFAFQFASNPVLRRWCEATGHCLRGAARWTEIPALPARAFKEFLVTCLPATDRPHVFRSSGTTQADRSCHFHNSATLALYEKAAAAWFWPHLVPETHPPPTLRVLSLIPSATQAPESSLARMTRVIRTQLALPADAWLDGVGLGGDGAWTLRLEPAIQYLSAAAAAGRPVLILATAFTLVHLLDAMAERRLSIPSAPGSRLMETGGYKNRSRALLKSELYASVDAHLGIPTTGVVMEYGMSELSSQAYDHVAGSDPLAVRTLRFPPWARAWVRDMDTGKPAARGTPGLLSIVDLANVASAIAILTEDLAVEHPGGIALLGRSAAAASKGCSLFSGDPNDAFAPLPLRTLTPLPDVAHAL